MQHVMESSLEAPKVMLCSVPTGNRRLQLDFHEGQQLSERCDEQVSTRSEPLLCVKNGAAGGFGGS